MTKIIVAFRNFVKAPKNGSHTQYESVDWVQCGSGKDVKYVFFCNYSMSSECEAFLGQPSTEKGQ